jgi:hypothetical protein
MSCSTFSLTLACGSTVALRIIWRKSLSAVWRKLFICLNSWKLSDEDRELAMSRFLVLQPHLEQDRPLRVVAAEAGLAFRTAQRWVAQYRAFGLAALVRKPRGDRGARRIVSETIKTAIEGSALESHPFPVTSVHGQITVTYLRSSAGIEFQPISPQNLSVLTPRSHDLQTVLSVTFGI